MNGNLMWAYQFNYTGPRFDHVSATLMRAAWDRSRWAGLGFTPVAIGLNEVSPDGPLGAETLPVERVTLPAGVAVYFLTHELDEVREAKS